LPSMKRLERVDEGMEPPRTPEGAVELSAVLFDLGTTLVGGSNTREAFMASAASLARLLRERGMGVDVERVVEVRLRNREYFKALRRATMREVVGEVWMAKDLESLGVKPSRELLSEALRAHCEAILSHRFVYEDAWTALEKLKRMGVEMAIVSNTSIHWLAEETLRRLGLAGFFKVVVTSAQVGWRKPHPAIFAEALRRLGLSPSEAVFVGDDPDADVAGAKGVGLRAVLVERHSPAQSLKALPDARLSSLTSLYEVLASL